jgi:CubicO group peptidase (beta-lactamase class C family)
MTEDRIGALAESPGFTSGPGHGYGFGLGVSVRKESGAKEPGSPGEYGWGGAAGTYFFVAPRESLIAILMVQTAHADAMIGALRAAAFEAVR